MAACVVSEVSTCPDRRRRAYLMEEKVTHTKLLCRPANHEHENFPGDHASVTFVGRPFPLEEAHEHFCRLRRWGLTFSTYNCQ
jgi:hypothetical protein